MSVRTVSRLTIITCLQMIPKLIGDRLLRPTIKLNLIALRRRTSEVVETIIIIIVQLQLTRITIILLDGVVAGELINQTVVVATDRTTKMSQAHHEVGLAVGGEAIKLMVNKTVEGVEVIDVAAAMLLVKEMKEVDGAAVIVGTVVEVSAVVAAVATVITIIVNS